MTNELKNPFDRPESLCRLSGRKREGRLLLFTTLLNYATSVIHLHLVVAISASLLLAGLVSSQLNEGQLSSNSIAPTIDYSHNMRILKLPKWTPIGSLIYRLKGSDGDPNTQLSFGVSGIIGRSLLEILPVAHSWNEADVYLRSKLEQNQYNFSIYVSDGNLTTHVESTILVTAADQLDDSLSQQEASQQQDLQLSELLTSIGQPSSSLNYNELPFVSTKHVFHLPENARPDETIGQVSALESQVSQLPVRFELRGQGADKFSIKHVFGPRGQSKADLVLAQPVDFERQNLFKLQVLALNAWTNMRLDTRNVHTMDVVIALDDVQDSPPIFRTAPHAIQLANNIQQGDQVANVEAEDGDYADQRPIHYALDAASPLASFFSIDKLTGQVRLIRPLNELLLLQASPSSQMASISGGPSGLPPLTVMASEAPDASSYDHLWPPMLSRLDLPLILVDHVNEAPQFIGGWQSTANPVHLSSSIGVSQIGNEMQPKTLHGFILETPNEKNPSGAAVQWFTNGTNEVNQPQALKELLSVSQNKPLVLDLGLGLNGTFQLTLEGQDAHLFQVEPALPVARQATITLLVSDKLSPSNWSLFDKDSSDHKGAFKLDVVARDLGFPHRMSSRIHCQIELLDLNDNSPHFSSDLYQFNVYETAARGSLVGTIEAKDLDSNSAGRVRYGPISGRGSHLFKLNPETGQITLEGQLDRERERSHLLLAEARDSSQLGLSNYTRLIITVLDVNDNAPIFLQSSYDAVLMADGTFHNPLVVHAVDGDEPGTANSQVAYEIIAGNKDEQFAIDSHSGQIFPAGQQSIEQQAARTASPPAQPSLPILPSQIPPNILEPIKPFDAAHQAGKILPGREIEETTTPSAGWLRSRFLLGGTSESSKLGGNVSSRIQVEPSDLSVKRMGKMDQLDFDKSARLDLLQTSEQMSQSTSASGDQQHLRSLLLHQQQTQSSGSQSNPLRLPPIVTLIVRAHDFGIPLRSSTVKVNIYNQALSTRSLSIILNGTADQLEAKREAIERAFGSLTGSKATIESIEALSDSSSISVAQVRLSQSQHSLVDLTDLSALSNAIEHHTNQQQQQQQQQQYAPPYSYTYPGRHEVIVPSIEGQAGRQSSGNPPDQAWYRVVPAASNLSQSNSFVHSNIFGPQVDAFGRPESLIEHKLLIYIIIVAVCILSLLVIWMIYSCIQEDRQSKMAEKEISSMGRHVNESNRLADSASQTAPKTGPYAGSGIASGLMKQRQQSGVQPSGSHLSGFQNTSGQVWFQPSSLDEMRRASSAPSANGSLHSDVASAIRIRNGRGQFFPNTIGYLHNLAALETNSPPNELGDFNRDPSQRHNGSSGQLQKRRNQNSTMAGKRSRCRVVPAENQDQRARRHSSAANSNDLSITSGLEPLEQQPKASSKSESNGSRSKRRPQGQLTSGRSSNSSPEVASSADEGTLILDSDQELLGFDSTGTPIIATLTGRSGGSNLSIGSRLPAAGSIAGVSSSLKTSTKDSEQAKEKSGLKAEATRKEVSDAKTSVLSELNAKLDNRKKEAPKQALKAMSIEAPQGTTVKETPSLSRQASDSGLIGTNGVKVKEVGSETSVIKMDTQPPAPAVSTTSNKKRPLEREASARQLDDEDGEWAPSPASATTQDTAHSESKLASEIKNGELLGKQSIFAITYNGLSTEKLLD